MQLSHTEEGSHVSPKMASTSLSSSSSAGDFSSILSSYRTLSLGSLQSHLTSLVEPLTSLQTSSLASRKKLADQTREFKKLPEEKKVEGFKPLLKSYQIEIDELTKRAKDAEGGLRRVEERLRDVVDPVEVLEKVLVSMKAYRFAGLGSGFDDVPLTLLPSHRIRPLPSPS